MRSPPGTPDGHRRARNRTSTLGWILSISIVATLVLGLIGYYTVEPEGALREELRSTGRIAHFLDALYLTLNLLFLSGKNTGGNPFLMGARWTGALFAFAGLLKLLVPHLEERYRRLRIRFLRGHTVIIGVGEKGRSFARAAIEAGSLVVASDLVDRDAHLLAELPPETCRRRLFFVGGDATEPDVLDGLGLAEANVVVVATGDDFTNLTIARLVVQKVRPASGQVKVLVHVSSPLLRLDGLTGIASGFKVRLHPFSVPALAARQLEMTWPLGVLADWQGADAVHLVFVGFGDVAEEILLQRLVAIPSVERRARPGVTIFAREPQVVQSRLISNFPRLSELLGRFEILSFDPQADLTEEMLASVERDLPVTAVIVTAATDAEAVVLARRVRARTRQTGRWAAPVFVHLWSPEAFAASLSPLSEVRWLSAAIEPFGGLREVCSTAALQAWDEVAEKLHDDWLKGPDPKHGSPAVVEWHDLDEEYRQTNRRAVDHFEVKLAALGYVIRGRPLALRRPLILDEPRLQKLAALEHESWMIEKLLGGWTWGPERDAVRRRHEDLLPYDELDGEESKDVAQVRKLTQLFNSAIASSSSNGAPLRLCFRERRFALACEVPRGAVVEEVIAKLAAELGTMEVEHRLGDHQDELWTFVIPASVVELRLAHAVRVALKTLSIANGPARRYRFVVVAARPDDPGVPGRRAIDEAVAPLLEQSSDVEMIVEVRDRGGRGLLDFLLRSCDHLLAIRMRAASATAAGETLVPALVEAWPRRRSPRPPFEDDRPSTSAVNEIWI